MKQRDKFHDPDQSAFHDQDQIAAVARAKMISGEVVKSMAPGKLCTDTDPGWGYWSGPVSMLRTFETRVYPAYKGD